LITVVVVVVISGGIVAEFERTDSMTIVEASGGISF
jgi:hypothetical protein